VVGLIAGPGARSAADAPWRHPPGPATFIEIAHAPVKLIGRCGARSIGDAERPKAGAEGWLRPVTVARDDLMDHAA
jgi:hypothetical protein